MVVQSCPPSLKIILEHTCGPVSFHICILAQQHDQVVFDAVVGKIKLHAIQKFDTLCAKIEQRLAAIADCYLKILKRGDIQRLQGSHRCHHGAGRLPQQSRNAAWGLTISTLPAKDG